MTNFPSLRRITTVICMTSFVIASSPSSGFATSDSPAMVCALQNTNSPNCPQPPAGSVIPDVTPTGVYLPPPSDPNHSTGGGGGGGGGGGLLWLLGAFVAAAAIYVAVDSLTGKGNESVAKLDDKGPRLPERELLGSYQVQGLIYPEWPLVVEVSAQPGSSTYLQIIPADAEKDAIPPLVVSASGGVPFDLEEAIRPAEISRTERGTLALFALPRNLRAKPHHNGSTADDGFRSARLSVLSGHMENGKFVPRPLEVFAIGAGPNAVGSAAVTINRFAPVSTGRRADYTIVFNKKRQFDYLRANLVERRASNGGFQRTMVAKRDLCTDASGRDLCVNGPPSFPYETAGEWPEKPGKQLDKRRMYHMELRAWSRRGPASGWLIGQAPRALQWP